MNLNGAAIVNYSSASPLDSIRGQVITGFANGSWNQLGICSSLAANNPGTAIAYAEASDLGVGSFAGQSVDQTAVLLRYDYTGDANLDGVVDTSDFTRLANHFNSTTTTLWSDGDFNYDGVVNALDFNALATNFGLSMSSPGLSLLVPEPAGLVCIALASAALARRRQR
jgi:hypothetical protein